MNIFAQCFLKIIFFIVDSLQSLERKIADGKRRRKTNTKYADPSSNEDNRRREKKAVELSQKVRKKIIIN